jgi:hypothetical protein
MKTKQFLFAGLLMASYSIQAQNNGHPYPASMLSKEEIFAGKFIELYSKKAPPGVQGKPTTVKQRMIASSRLQGNTTSVNLVDSARYVYSGTRGSVPNSPAGPATTVSSFDTAYLLFPSDNFATRQLLYSRQYNSNNQLTLAKTYNSTLNAIEQQWISYYPDQSIQKESSLNYSSSNTDWSYTEHEYSTTGKVLRDSLASQNSGMTPPLTTTVQFHQYEAPGRPARTLLSATGLPSGIDEIDTTYFFYNAINDTLPARDSTFKQMFQSSGNTTQKVATEYTYNTANLLVQQIFYNYTPLLVPSTKYSSTYNAAGQRTSYIMEVYNSGSGLWENNSKEEREYNAQGINTKYTVYNWDAANGTWKEQIKSIAVLNANQMTDSLINYFMGAPYSIQTHKYNSFRNETQSSEYQGNNQSIINYYYEEYDDATGLKNKEEQPLVILYPNPVKDQLNFRIDYTKNNPTWICNIFDLSGKKWHTANLKGQQNKIQVDHLPPGKYYLEVSDPKKEHSSTQSFIKL